MLTPSEPQEIEIVSDSKLVVEQTNGNWRVKNDALRPMVYDAQRLLAKLFPDAWQLRWAKREENVEADKYCGLAIEAGRNRNPWHKPKREGKILDPFSSAYDPSKPA